MELGHVLDRWPVLRRLREGDPLGLGKAVRSERSRTLTPRMDRVKPIRSNGRVVQQVGLPYHWGSRGLTTGGSANDLAHMVLDPNVHIQEVKAFTCDIRPGRRPR